jgi:hypothetical protein
LFKSDWRCLLTGWGLFNIPYFSTIKGDYHIFSERTDLD